MYTEPHTTPWAGLHTFIVHLGPQSCRCPGLLSEAAFDCVMDALNWRMPYHLRAFHCSSPETAAANPVLRAMPEFSAPLEAVLFTAPAAPMRLKDKRRKQTLSVRSKYGDYALAETEDGYGRLYHVDGITSSLIVRLEACPITLQEASAYVEAHHRHNAGPKFHKFSLCLRAPGEAEPVGVAIASIPKARCQMDGLTLEINRCCADPRYFEAMSGHELLRWLEAETIGSYSLSRLPSGVEVACDLRVDQSGEKYRRYHEEICKLAVGKLLRME